MFCRELSLDVFSKAPWLTAKGSEVEHLSAVPDLACSISHLVSITSPHTHCVLVSIWSCLTLERARHTYVPVFALVKFVLF